MLINTAKKRMASWLEIKRNLVSLNNRMIRIPKLNLTLQLFRHQFLRLWYHCAIIFILAATKVHSSAVVLSAIRHRAINGSAPNVKSIFVASVLSTLNPIIMRMVLQEWQLKIVFTFQLAAWETHFSNILIGIQQLRWTAFSVKMLSTRPITIGSAKIKTFAAMKSTVRIVSKCSEWILRMIIQKCTTK